VTDLPDDAIIIIHTPQHEDYFEIFDEEGLNRRAPFAPHPLQT
jgi:hypothetical protein